jgi:REP element-mobilizing transposase RayT
MKKEELKPEQYYHIFNRSNNKETIFKDEANYMYFLDLLKKYILPIATVYSYCLLPNHFHLLIRTENFKSKKISQSFANLFNSYTKAINKKYNRTGSLFQKGFKRKLINNERYLQQVIIYINTNSKHHNIADYNKYKHSSYQALISNKKTHIKRDEVKILFDTKSNLNFVLQEKNLKIENIKELTFE